MNFPVVLGRQQFVESKNPRPSRSYPTIRGMSPSCTPVPSETNWAVIWPDQIAPQRIRCASIKKPFAGLLLGWPCPVGDQLIDPRHPRKDRLHVPPHQARDIAAGRQIPNARHRGRRHHGIAYPTGLNHENLFNVSHIQQLTNSISKPGPELITARFPAFPADKRFAA